MKAHDATNHQLFRKSVAQDNPAIEPNPALAEGLHYYYTIKQPTRNVHRNSFSGMFVWLLSMKGAGFKAGIASVCLLYFVFVGNIKNSSSIQDISDTCQVHQMLVDSSYLAKDTCK